MNTNYNNMNKNCNIISFSTDGQRNKVLNAYDIISLNAIMRRQYYVLKDLYQLYDKYPNEFDTDLIGSLDALFRAMCDMTDSLTQNAKLMH